MSDKRFGPHDAIVQQVVGQLLERDATCRDFRQARQEGQRQVERMNLKDVRAFAEAWSEDDIGQQSVGQLPWGHNLVPLTKPKALEERLTYCSRLGALPAANPERETVWASQAQIVELFGVDQSGVSRHVRNILKGAEIDQESNMQEVHIAGSRVSLLVRMISGEAS